MKTYTAKNLSKLAGVSVRTLHYYDEIGLLKPAIRSEANYRLYGKNELLVLQQILFYKELDFSLEAIKKMLNDPSLDMISSLQNQRKALLERQKQLTVLVNTIDKTVLTLKNKKMISEKELYMGFPNNEGERLKKEAIEHYGEHMIQQSEKYLRSLSKEEFEALKNEQKEIFDNLFKLSDESPENNLVQLTIAKHYKNIRQFWGTDGSKDSQWAEYKGLGELYISDERFTERNGIAQPKFAQFLANAIAHFAEQQLD